MFRPYLNACLYYVWRCVETMFTYLFKKVLTLYLKTCFYNICRHFYTMLENMFTQWMKAEFFKTCLHSWRFMFTWCFISFLYLIWTYICTMFKQCLKTCLHLFDSIFIHCLQSYFLKINEKLKVGCFKMVKNNPW